MKKVHYIKVNYNNDKQTKRENRPYGLWRGMATKKYLHSEIKISTYGEPQDTIQECIKLLELKHKQLFTENNTQQNYEIK